MTTFKRISMQTHAAAETVAGPVVMTAPFVLGFGPGATMTIFFVGALLFALSLAGNAQPRVIPVADHALFDYGFAAATLFVGLAFLANAAIAPGMFLVGLSVAHLALAASTRFSLPARS